MPRSQNSARAYDNIVNVTDEVQIGQRTSTRRGNWYLVKLGNQFPRLSLKTTDQRQARGLALRAYPAWLEDPYSDWRSTGGMAQAVAIFSPESITLPISIKGRPVFKLGELARANGIDFTEEEAHDALADVRATVKLARLLRERVPAIWEQMLINATKHGAIEFMKSKAAFCLGEVSFGNPSSWLGLIDGGPFSPFSRAISARCSAPPTSAPPPRSEARAPAPSDQQRKDYRDHGVATSRHRIGKLPRTELAARSESQRDAPGVLLMSRNH